jgi:2-polyprenyl-3-methyl-5-hydroxy-6-metoxy-1,4-benzoquinol methylase
MKKNYYSNIRSDVISFIPKRSYKKIIEVGGGQFPTLLKFNELHNAELWGIDIEPYEKKDINFIHGSVESDLVKNKVPDDYFDLIIANDVIEHLEDSVGFMKFAVGKLNSGGYLIVSVPNIRQIRAFYYIFIKGTFPTKESGLFDKTHLRWFCSKDVINLGKNANLEFIDYFGVGRLLPHIFKKSLLSEFLALQFIILFRKK